MRLLTLLLTVYFSLDVWATSCSVDESVNWVKGLKTLDRCCQENARCFEFGSKKLCAGVAFMMRKRRKEYEDRQFIVVKSKGKGGSVRKATKRKKTRTNGTSHEKWPSTLASAATYVGQHNSSTSKQSDSKTKIPTIVGQSSSIKSSTAPTTSWKTVANTSSASKLVPNRTPTAKTSPTNSSRLSHSANTTTVSDTTSKPTSASNTQATTPKPATLKSTTTKTVTRKGPMASSNQTAKGPSVIPVQGSNTTPLGRTSITTSEQEVSTSEFPTTMVSDVGVSVYVDSSTTVITEETSSNSSGSLLVGEESQEKSRAGICGCRLDRDQKEEKGEPLKTQHSASQEQSKSKVSNNTSKKTAVKQNPVVKLGESSNTQAPPEKRQPEPRNVDAAVVDKEHFEFRGPLVIDVADEGQMDEHELEGVPDESFKGDVTKEPTGNGVWEIGSDREKKDIPDIDSDKMAKTAHSPFQKKVSLPTIGLSKDPTRS